MTSRERVLTAINHQEPDRVPIDLGTSDTRPRASGDLLDGVTVLEGKAEVFEDDSWSGKLYRELKLQEPRQIDISLIPYYAWGNRGECDMTIWMPIR